MMLASERSEVSRSLQTVASEVHPVVLDLRGLEKGEDGSSPGIC